MAYSGSKNEILFDTFLRSPEDVAVGGSSLILLDGFHSGILWGLDRACGGIAALGPDGPDGMLEGVNSFAAGLKENLETLGSPPPSAKFRELPFAAVGVMPTRSCGGDEPRTESFPIRRAASLAKRSMGLSFCS